jgi:peptide deformylase
MVEIIKDTEKLTSPATPLQFLTDQGVEKEGGLEIIGKIKEVMDADSTILALAAPQIGIDSRIFCIRFDDQIKTFINPIVTKKSKYEIKPETFASMPGKEILITRPEELTVVYYTDDFKYEENKLLGAAARLFDQHCQLLDGVTPAELGLVSDVETDGSLADLSDEEIAQVTDIYKQFIKAKSAALQSEIEKDPELEKAYKQLKFTEKVITGDALIIESEEDANRHKEANKLANRSVIQAANIEKQQNKANLKQFLRRKGKK